MSRMLFGYLILVIVLSISGCSQPIEESHPVSTVFSYDEAALNKVLVDASQAKGVSYAQFDVVIVPPGQRSAAAIEKLGKYLFGDEYVVDIGSLGGTAVVAASTQTNTWSPQGTLSETVNEVTGFNDNLVRAVYKVNDITSTNNGKYHVYRYMPWTANLVGVTLDVWFGKGHVFYFNPVNGQEAAGEPYLELFPVASTSDEVEEVRIESTSYYKFRSLAAGKGITDLGSTLAKMETVLGNPTSTVPVASMNDVVWSDRGVLFTYPISGTTNGAYIHYDLPNDVKVRIFLSGEGTDLHIAAMYFVRTP